jgi:hypothetical protein
MIPEIFAIGALFGYVMPIPTFLLLTLVLFVKYKQSDITIESLKRNAQNMSWITVINYIQHLTKSEETRAGEQTAEMFTKSPV